MSMKGFRRKRREAEAAISLAAAEAMKPRGCLLCGLVFADAASFAIGHDPHWPDGCLPPGAAGQLVAIDGVWIEAWRSNHR